MVVRDIGSFVGRYFQILGFVLLVSMILEPFIWGEFRLDLTFLLMWWAGAELRCHSPTARKLVLLFTTVGFAMAGLFLAFALIAGKEGLKIRIGRPIESPTWGQIALVVGVIVAVLGPPYALLSTRRARAEFTKGP